MNYDIVLRVVDKTSAGLKKTEQSISKVSKSAKLAKGALVGVGAAIGGVVAAGATVKKTIDSFDALAKRARNVGAATEEGFENFQVIDQLLGEAGLSAEQTTRALRNLDNRILQGTKGSAAYADITAALGDSIYDANGQLKDSTGLFEAIGQAAANGTIDLADFSKVVGEQVGPKVFNAIQSMVKSGMSLEEAMASVRANSNIVGLDAATNAEKFNDTLGRVTNTMGQLLTDAVTPLLPVLNELADDLLAAMPGFIDGVKDAFERMKPLLNVTGEIVTNILIPALKMMWDGWMLILDVLGPLVEKAIPAVKQGFTLVSEVVGTVIETLNGFINSILNIGAKVEEVFTNFTEMGSNIVGGVVKGIKDNIAKVKDAVGNMASDAISSFKSFLGINSPSKVFQGFGNNITEGLVNGIIEGSENIHPAMETISKDMEQQGSKIGDSFSKSLSQGLEDGKLELNDFKGFFMDTIAQLATQALGSGLGVGAGAAGGLGGVLASGLSSLFFADGGQIQAGKAGIVGEAGPELVKGPATVYSNSETQGMLSGGSTGGDNITYAPVFQTTINPGDNTSPQDAEKFAQQFNATIEAKVSDTIIKMQNRRGAFQEARPY